MRNKYNKKIKNVDLVINKRYSFLITIMIILFMIIIFKLFSMQINNADKYSIKLQEVTANIISGQSSPRGRILDRNYNVIVDNVAVKKISYKKEKGITKKEEIAIAYQLSKILDVDYSNLKSFQLKDFWIVNNYEESKSLITKDEYNKYEMRKLTDNDLYKLKLKRISDEILSKYSDIDKKTAFIYYLMNNGYSYDNKIIKDEDVSEKEFAIISENSTDLKGVSAILDWERIYPYGDTFKTILGKVSNDSGIPIELKDYYLEKDYSLNDRVGISYLEYQYEDILKGIKPTYKLLSDNSYEIVKEGSRGNDIVLSIDINLQVELENILKEEVLKTKKEPNTEYYNRSMAVISDPNTGAILAMAGKQVVLNDDKELVVYDYTPGITTSPVIAGSVVKGASILTGYNAGAIEIGTEFSDECIKIKDTPEKCSFSRNLGTLNDIKALTMSSNVYQFKTAIKVANAEYKYNKPLVIDKSAFDIYRNMYSSFGLGVKTGIDLPVESAGYKGSAQLSGHLLDFVIGQYDTYTPIQLSQYISTLANGGNRYQPILLKEIRKSTNTDELGDTIEIIKPNLLNKIDVEQKYIDRVREGFKSVMAGPLGYGYMGSVKNTSGKTGTSESFLDSDSDGIIDKETTSKSFVGYAPSENPIMSVVVVSPDISHDYNASSYNTSVNKRITSKITEKFFEIYK